jgi:hypothetical protein
VRVVAGCEGVLVVAVPLMLVMLVLVAGPAALVGDVVEDEMLPIVPV